MLTSRSGCGDESDRGTAPDLRARIGGGGGVRVGQLSAGNWTRLERRSAFSRAVDDAGVYVLPARFDDSELPGLLSDVAYIDLRDCTPGQFADLVAAKLADLAISPSLISARADGGAAAGVGAGDFTVVPPRQRERVLRGLPPKSPVFAGREADLSKLLTLLGPDGPADGQPRVAVVTGLPGVGKTELAVQAAYVALENGWFPGGVLFIDMRGYDQDRAVMAGAALDEMLRAVKIPAEEIPAGDDHRSRLFASEMADKAAAGARILVVINNVASAEIAEALIPVAGATLVTSRHAMTDLRAQQIDLDELSEAAAVEMLAGELREKRGTDTRVADQHEDALAIVRLCGELPLALHIVAALLAEAKARPLSSMARDLRNTSTRLDELRYQDADSERGVRAAFELSFRKLGAKQTRILRLLPVNFGQEVSTEAVAAMAELDVRTARQRLEKLHRAHLIRAGSSYGRNGRWQMHSLIRLYVSGLPGRRDDKRVAFLRLLLYYLESTGAATRLLDPAAARPADGPFADRGEALDWLDAEYPNLAPFGYMFLSEPEFARTLTADLVLWLWRYFELRRYIDDWINFTTVALTIARALGDRAREGEALTKLSGAFRQARRFDEAAGACRDAIVIQRERSDRHAEGIALNNLAAALIEANRYDEAIVAAQEAVAIFQEMPDRHREGIAVTHLGGALTGTGQRAEGVAAYEKAIRIFRELDDQHGVSRVLTSLGNALRDDGREPEELIDLHRRSAKIMAEAGDPHGEGVARINLTASLIEAGLPAEAIAAARDAVTLMRDANDPHSLGAALVNLSIALLETGQAGEAVEALGDAVTAYHRSGDQDAEADARISLGTALKADGNFDAAIAAFRAVAERCHETASRRREGQALGNLGHALLEAQQIEEAITTLRAAATVSGAAHDLEGEAKALGFLGTALLPVNVDDAIAAFRDAAELCRQVGNGELAEVASGALQAAEAVKQLKAERSARLAAGRFEEVVADYRASSRHPIAVRAVVGGMAAELGISLSKAGRFGQAIAILEEAATALHEAGAPDRERTTRAELDAAREAQLEAQTAADALERVLRSADADGKALRTALDEASQHLGPHDVRFFRLLSANPGPDISLPAAAILAVADRSVIQARLEELSGLAVARKHRELSRRISHLYWDDARIARGALDVLTQMRLVERDPVDPERWRLPAAIRPFAAQQGREHATRDLRGPMQTLLSIYYLVGALAASAPLDSGIIAPALRGSQAKGLRWLAAEYPNLVVTVHEAANDDDDLSAVIALDLTRALEHIMSLQRRFDDAIALGPIARRAAQRLHDRRAEAVVLRNLGGTLVQVRRQDEAVTALRDALAIYRDLGDLDGEGTTLTNLGSALTYAGQFAESGTVLRDAIDIHRRRGNRFSEAVALTSLGALLDMTGQIEEAITTFKDADLIYRKIGDQHHRSGALAQLAHALRKAGHDHEAIKAYRRAATLARVTGDLPLAAAVLTSLAEIYRAAGQQAEADDVLEEAAQLAPVSMTTPRERSDPDSSIPG